MQRSILRLPCLAMAAVIIGGCAGAVRDVQASHKPDRPAVRSPRAASAPGEQVPKGVTAIRVTLQRPPRRAGLSKLGVLSSVPITNRSKVSTAIKLADSLKVPKPGEVWNCPAIIGPEGRLTVTYSAGPAGPALATAQISLPIGWPAAAIGATPCAPIGFTISGHAMRTLIGADFVRDILALAGLSLR